MKQKLLLTGALAAGALALHAADKTQQDTRPNILFILSDDHTSQTWGVYGGILEQYAQTDNIRRIASEGAVLDNCFCTNSISTPSRAAYSYRPCYSHTNGVYTLEDTLDTAMPTICQRVSKSRIPYRTGGKVASEIATPGIRLLFCIS